MRFSESEIVEESRYVSGRRSRSQRVARGDGQSRRKAVGSKNQKTNARAGGPGWSVPTCDSRLTRPILAWISTGLLIFSGQVLSKTQRPRIPAIRGGEPPVAD